MRPSGSPKTVPASSNDTPCFARFLAAFCGSHSNLSTTRYYSHASMPATFFEIPPGRYFLPAYSLYSSAIFAEAVSPLWMTTR